MRPAAGEWAEQFPFKKKMSKNRGRETCAREVKDPTLGNLILNFVKLGRPGFFLFFD